MSISDFVDVVQQTFREFGEDKVSRLAAALSYYAIFSIAPILVIIIAVAGLYFGRQTAQEQIVGQIQSFIGSQQAAQLIGNMVASARSPGSSVIATIIGIVALLFGATGAFVQLQDGLNTIWGVEEASEGGVLNMIKDRLTSFLMILIVGLVLLVALVLTTALSAASQSLNLFPNSGVVVELVNFVLSFAVIMVLFAAVFKVLPDVEIVWEEVWLGAGVTALLFTIGKWAIGFYLGRTAVSDAYGAAGSLVVLLLWIYYSSQIMYLGAEFTQVYANRYGTKIAPERGAARLKKAERVQPGALKEERVSKKQKEPAPAASAAASSAGPTKKADGSISPQAPGPSPFTYPLPEAQPSLLALSAVLATLVGFISGMVIRGRK